jgi:hypothetical protein
MTHVFGTTAPNQSGFDDGPLTSSHLTKVLRGGGLRLQNVGEKSPLRATGGKTRFGLRGDFKIELSFVVNQMPIPESGNGTKVMLRLDYADRGKSGLTVALNASPDGLLLWQIDDTTNGQQNHKVVREPAFTNVFESPQTITIERTGRQIDITAGAENVLRQFTSSLATDADVSRVAMWLTTGGVAADLSVDLKEILIEADTFANDIAPPAGLSGWTMTFWLFAAILILFGAFWSRQSLRT